MPTSGRKGIKITKENEKTSHVKSHGNKPLARPCFTDSGARGEGGPRAAAPPQITSMLWTSTRAGCPSEGRLGITLMSWPPGPNLAQM